MVGKARPAVVGPFLVSEDRSDCIRSSDAESVIVKLYDKTRRGSKMRKLYILNLIEAWSLAYGAGQGLFVSPAFVFDRRSPIWAQADGR